MLISHKQYRKMVAGSVWRNENDIMETNSTDSVGHQWEKDSSEDKIQTNMYDSIDDSVFTIILARTQIYSYFIRILTKHKEWVYFESG